MGPVDPAGADGWMRLCSAASAIKLRTNTPRSEVGEVFLPGPGVERNFVYSNQMGYQTSNLRLLWTIVPPPTPLHPHPNTLSNPPPPPTSPPPGAPPPNIGLVPMSPTNC